ncbi:hypothetical protein [Gloeocapsa sp. PCC 73106]|uniref:hypothetical protein n=1 Tax=Gloeocapsa sp. PCC 73106 TaxID=102232 RepID=UPI00055940F9|nr:hypothetical protein [Gloeocapsa sp. PCC 73106]
MQKHDFLRIIRDSVFKLGIITLLFGAALFHGKNTSNTEVTRIFAAALNILGFLLMNPRNGIEKIE